VKKSAPIIVSSSNSNTESNSNRGANHNSNSESDNSAESNANRESNLSSPPPTDKEVVLAQLTDLEHEWTVANLNADKKKLVKFWQTTMSAGKQWQDARQASTSLLSVSLMLEVVEDLRLTLRGDRQHYSARFIMEEDRGSSSICRQICLARQ
jgi:hypothetical protein